MNDMIPRNTSKGSKKTKRSTSRKVTSGGKNRATTHFHSMQQPASKLQILLLLLHLHRSKSRITKPDDGTIISWWSIYEMKHEKKSEETRWRRKNWKHYGKPLCLSPPLWKGTFVSHKVEKVPCDIIIMIFWQQRKSVTRPKCTKNGEVYVFYVCMEKNKVRSKSGYKVYFLLRISVRMLLFDSIIT